MTGTTGIVSLPKLKSPPQDSNFVHQGFAIEVKIPDPVNGDRIARRVLKGWQLADLAARTPNEAVVLDLKFQISRAPINPNVNLALGKLITDSAKSFPAQLVALVDGNPSTSYNFPAEKQSWVEIDLGRDRVVGAIQIEADSMPKSFQILVRNTGDKLEDSIPWATEPDFEWTKQFQATPKTISNGKPVMYFYSPIQVRYIRLVNRSGGAGKISGITLMPRVTAVSQ